MNTDGEDGNTFTFDELRIALCAFAKCMGDSPETAIERVDRFIAWSTEDL